MKKSTIFLLVIVYIASFLIVGIFGISVRSYDPTFYVEKINVEVAPNQLVGVEPAIPKGLIADNEEIRHYKCTVRYNYVEKDQNGEIKCIVRLKASAYPSNATTSDLRLQTTGESDVATVTQEDNVYFNVAFKIKGAFTFDIYSTDGYGAYTTVNMMYYTGN